MLRSQEWFGGTSKSSFLHRSWMKAQGFPPDSFDGRPVIGICNTWSELTPCNSGLRDLADRVKRGVFEAGGFPVEFPVMSLGETQLRPTAMLFRNLAAMDVEESIRGNPIDGVVLLAGCDKTTPATVMGAASCDLPTLVVSAGPMLSGRLGNRRIGSGTDVWRLSEEVNAGTRSLDSFLAAESAMSRSIGFCNTMGTASTMASVVESLGIALTGNAAIPAVDARRRVLAQLSGRRIVDLVREDVRLSHVLTPAAFANAIRTVAAIGGSTNAVIHLIAIARRLGHPLGLDDWDRLGRGVPTLVNLMPAGVHLMEDFHAAGGVPAVHRLLLAAGLLDGTAMTVTGRTLGDNVADAEVLDADVIRPLDRPLLADGGIAVLRGNLAPSGAVVKPAAADPALLRHRGRAVVFTSIEDYHHRIDDPDLDIEADSVMVLQHCGPRGYPGMPEVGNLGLPPKLLRAGVTDMVRISDARMSGTAYGTVVLHVAPEAALGGPLALVHDGDPIVLDVTERVLHLDVTDHELARRRAEWVAPAAPPGANGYQRLFVDHVLQADEGCDLDFLVEPRKAGIPRHSH